jgi:hypothetical protein
MAKTNPAVLAALPTGIADLAGQIWPESCAEAILVLPPSG